MNSLEIDLAMSRSHLWWGAVAAFTTLGMALAGLQLQTDGIGLFWPAAGVGAGLMLITSGRDRVAVGLGMLLALSICNATQDRSLATSLVFMAGNMGQAVLVAAAADRWCGTRMALDRIWSVIQFLTIGCVVVSLVGLFAATGLRLTAHAQGSLSEVWGLWFRSHGIGILTVVPILLTYNLQSLNRRAFAAEDILLTVALASIAILVIGSLLPKSSVTMLLVAVILAPLIGWVWLRASVVRASIAALVLAVVMLWQATEGAGAFTGNLLLAQLILAAVVGGLLLLGAWRAETSGLDRDDRSERLLADTQAVVVLIPLVLFALFAWWRWRAVELDAQARVTRMTTAVSEHATRLLDVQDALLEAALARVSGLSRGEVAADRGVHEFLKSLSEGSTTSTAVALVDAQLGLLVASPFSYPVTRNDVSHREYVTAHRHGTARHHVGAVIQTQTRGLIGFTVSKNGSRDGIGCGLGRAPIEHSILLRRASGE